MSAPKRFGVCSCGVDLDALAREAVDEHVHSCTGVDPNEKTDRLDVDRTDAAPTPDGARKDRRG